MTERELQTFSRQLAEWRESPVTETLQAAMARLLAQRKTSILEAYWRGEPETDSARLAVQMVEQWVEDFFESEAEDVIEVLKDDE